MSYRLLNLLLGLVNLVFGATAVVRESPLDRVMGIANLMIGTLLLAAVGISLMDD